MSWLAKEEREGERERGKVEVGRKDEKRREDDERTRKGDGWREGEIERERK